MKTECRKTLTRCDLLPIQFSLLMTIILPSDRTATTQPLNIRFLSPKQQSTAKKRVLVCVDARVGNLLLYFWNTLVNTTVVTTSNNDVELILISPQGTTTVKYQYQFESSELPQ